MNKPVCVGAAIGIYEPLSQAGIISLSQWSQDHTIIIHRYYCRGQEAFEGFLYKTLFDTSMRMLVKSNVKFDLELTPAIHVHVQTTGTDILRIFSKDPIACIIISFIDPFRGSQTTAITTTAHA